MKKNMNWKRNANLLRKKIISISYENKISHLASSLSCVDIITVLYDSVLGITNKNFNSKNRNRFILSKGHAASTLYTKLNQLKIINDQELNKIGHSKSLLEEHPSYLQNGVEISTGSLGHGLPVANGIALASKINNINYQVYVLMSDGECNEGSVWEGSLFSSKYKLNNLTVFIDYNKWQATDRSDKVLNINPLKEKFESFGWFVKEINGHNFNEIYNAINLQNYNKPKVIIANTIKGKGISFMEDDNNWHYRIPNKIEYIKALKELDK